jgi:hypothetical protein
VAGRQHHLAVGRRDDAAVFHRRRDQEDLAAGRRGDRALIADLARVGGAVEVVFTGQEIGIRDIQAGGHQPVHIHARAGAEQHAVGINQEHLAVRLQRAEDHAGVLSGDAVQHLAVGALLDEARQLVGAMENPAS